MSHPSGETGSCSLRLGFGVEIVSKRCQYSLSGLPSVFDGIVGGARQTTRANGFAALKELEHYMQPHFDAQGTGDDHFTQHRFEWDGSEHRVPAPPFSTVYLLDDSNLAGVRIADFTDVFQMIAEFLLLDFEQTRFAMDKRSVRSKWTF